MSCGGGSRRSRALNERLDDFRVLAGSEVNIQPDGSLDYDDEVLAELDWVMASVHTSFRIGERRMTERMMAAMEHPLVDAIGHPTGRKILRREPYAVDVERLVEQAARDRHDARDQRGAGPARPQGPHARLAAEAGVTIVIDSDAHGAGTLGADAVRHRDRAPRMADEGGRRQHAHVDRS